MSIPAGSPETPREFSYRILIGQYSTESKIAEFDRLYDRLEDQSSMLDVMAELLVKVKKACDLDSIPMLKLAAVFVLKFLAKNKTPVIAMILSRDNLIRALDEYRAECDNPAPDLVMRRRLREEMFKARDAYDATMKAV